MNGRIVRGMPWLLVLALFAAALALHLRAALAAETPEAAIEALTASRGERYAGDCAATVSPDDIGAVCSRLVEEREQMRAYLTGRTFSEFDTWLFLAWTGDGWCVVGEAPLDFHAPAPQIPWP